MNVWALLDELVEAGELRVRREGGRVQVRVIRDKRTVASANDILLGDSLVQAGALVRAGGQ